MCAQSEDRCAFGGIVATRRMTTTKLVHREVTHAVIGAFYEVYNTLGFGFLESIYAAALERELVARGHRVAREFAVHVTYKGEDIGFHRADMLVDEKVVVEIKSTTVLAPTAERQLFNYLRGTSLDVGLLLHFGPEPKFYRSVSPRRQNDPRNPDHPDASGPAIAPRPQSSTQTATPVDAIRIIHDFGRAPAGTAQ